MVAEDTTVYLAIGALLGIVWVVLAAVVSRASGDGRLIGFIATVPALSMGLAYVLMHLEVLTVETAGRDQSVVRFIGYTFAILALTYILYRAARLPTTVAYLLAGLFLATLWVQLVGWFLTGALESLVTALGLGVFVASAYVLFGPAERFAAETGGSRQLLYEKLRNLWIICYGTLIVTSAASEQVLGILTPFVSSVAAGYVDLVWFAGIGFLTLSALHAFDESEAVDSQVVYDDTSAESEPTS